MMDPLLTRGMTAIGRFVDPAAFPTPNYLFNGAPAAHVRTWFGPIGISYERDRYDEFIISERTEGGIKYGPHVIVQTFGKRIG